MPRHDEERQPKPLRRPRSEFDLPTPDEVYDEYCARCREETEHSLGACLDCAVPRYQPTAAR